MHPILLIEDNPELLDNTAEMLQLANYNVITATNGREGLEKLKEHKYKVSMIVSDIMMPDIDGYGLLRAVGNIPELKAIPFVFITAKSEKQDFRKGMDLGADDYLVKPFTSDELLSIVAARLKKASGAHGQEISFDSELEEAFDGDDFINHPATKAKFRTKRLRSREGLFMQGDKAVYLYYIVEGMAKSYTINEHGKEYISRIYAEGDFIGHTALLDSGSHESSAMSLRDTTLALMTAEDFHDLLGKSKSFAGRFIKDLAMTNNQSELRLSHLAYNSARKKVAEALLYISACHKETNGNNTSFNFSREDISAVSGITPESVSRNLSDFRAEKLIDIQGGVLNIIDKKSLQNIRQ
jgi:CRP/FNR family transcriptional regulator, polysaccharide utilization system transcription regulator